MVGTLRRYHVGVAVITPAAPAYLGWEVDAELNGWTTHRSSCSTLHARRVTVEPAFGTARRLQCPGGSIEVQPSEMAVLRCSA